MSWYSDNPNDLIEELADPQGDATWPGHWYDEIEASERRNNMLTFKPYVTIRGSRTGRQITRDASPRRGEQPFASLVVPHPDGTATTFTLTYGALTGIDGAEPDSVTVFLHRKHSSEEGRDVHTEAVAISGR